MSETQILCLPTPSGDMLISTGETNPGDVYVNGELHVPAARIVALERQLAEAHEETDALVRRKAALTKTVEDLERQLAEARAALEAAVQLCERAADKLAPAGKRSNQIDRHTAEVLRAKAHEVRALAHPAPAAGESQPCSEGGER